MRVNKSSREKESGSKVRLSTTLKGGMCGPVNATQQQVKNRHKKLKQVFTTINEIKGIYDDVVAVVLAVAAAAFVVVVVVVVEVS